MAPEYILSLDYFFPTSKKVLSICYQTLHHPDAIPNSGHEILARWEEAGKVKHIITQNIDGLHQKAGSKNVIEFHGTLNTASCLNCGKIILQLRRWSPDADNGGILCLQPL